MSMLACAAVATTRSSQGTSYSAIDGGTSPQSRRPLHSYRDPFVPAAVPKRCDVGAAADHLRHDGPRTRPALTKDAQALAAVLRVAPLPHGRVVWGRDLDAALLAAVMRVFTAAPKKNGAAADVSIVRRASMLPPPGTSTDATYLWEQVSALVRHRQLLCRDLSWGQALAGGATTMCCFLRFHRVLRHSLPPLQPEHAVHRAPQLPATPAASLVGLPRPMTPLLKLEAAGVVPLCPSSASLSSTTGASRKSQQPDAPLMVSSHSPWEAVVLSVRRSAAPCGAASLLRSDADQQCGRNSGGRGPSDASSPSSPLKTSRHDGVEAVNDTVGGPTRSGVLPVVKRELTNGGERSLPSAAIPRRLSSTVSSLPLKLRQCHRWQLPEENALRFLAESRERQVRTTWGAVNDAVYSGVWPQRAEAGSSPCPAPVSATASAVGTASYNAVTHKLRRLVVHDLGELPLALPSRHRPHDMALITLSQAAFPQQPGAIGEVIFGNEHLSDVIASLMRQGEKRRKRSRRRIQDG